MTRPALLLLCCLGGVLATLSQAEASFGFGQMPQVSVGRYVNMTFDCQFNNNRQALIATIYVAHALKRMVLIPPAAAFLLDIFDLSELRQHVPIIVQDPHHHSFAPGDVRQALLTHSPITIQHIIAIHRDWPEAVISMPHYMQYAYIRHTFKFDGDAEAAEYDRLHRMVVLSPLLLRAAKLLTQVLPVNFVAVHMRVGDRKPYPLLDCEAIGALEAPLFVHPCTHRSDPVYGFVLMEEIVLGAVESGAVVFMATNDVHHETTQLFREALKTKGDMTVLSQDLLIQIAPDLASDSDLAAALAALPPLGSNWASALDMAICIMADRFFGVFESSWTEYVVLRRFFEGKADGPALLATFDRKTEKMFASPHSSRDYIHHRPFTLPNLMTHCPPASVQTGRLCACPSPLMECHGPACTTTTDRTGLYSVSAFPPSCASCRCSVPPGPHYVVPDVERRPWLQAAQRCVSLGGSLATVRTPQQLTRASNTCAVAAANFNVHFYYLYIGLVRVSGVWQWVDGSPAQSPLPWRAADDGGNSGETVVVFDCSANKFVDWGIGEHAFPVLCQL